MAVTYKDLFQTHIKYVEFLLSRTYILNQYLKDITNTGSEIEIEVREFLSHFIPKRFKITHGFICYAKDKDTEPKVSPQLDCIIVDTLVPHTIFPLSHSSGQEVVPLESVVGIVEIKRTLTAKSLEDAIEHLRKTIAILEIDKTNERNYMLGGNEVEFLSTGIYSNPLLGIISVGHDITMADLKKNDNEPFKKLIKECNENAIDLIGSFSGLLLTTMTKPKDEKDTSNFQVHTFRKKGDLYKYGFGTEEVISHAGIVSRIIGFIVAYLSHTSGRYNPMDKYYFQSSTWQKTE